MFGLECLILVWLGWLCLRYFCFVGLLFSLFVLGCLLDDVCVNWFCWCYVCGFVRFGFGCFGGTCCLICCLYGLLQCLVALCVFSC